MAVITGNNLANLLIGTNVNDTISGLGGNDTLIGLGGNDILNGGIGADIMVGGTGSDTYYVDNAGDVVAEGFNEGFDLIISSISLTLNVNGRFDVEDLRLTGGAITGIGNARNNVITGNNLNNNLNGLAGIDRLFGQGGNDNMLGGTGNDLLNGGIGADIMRGETGNDIYIVDNGGDNVIELAGVANGIDTIQSSINLSLNVGGRVNVENLTLTGAAINGIGNALNNVITGNNANNTLNGLGGNDILNGGLGNDNLIGNVGNDFFRFNTALGATNVDNVAGFSPSTTASSSITSSSRSFRWEVSRLPPSGSARHPWMATIGSSTM